VLLLGGHIDGGGAEGHLDLGQSIGAVVHQILGLARVNARYAQQQLAGETQGNGDDFDVDDGLDGFGYRRLEQQRLCELALQMGRQPDAGQWSFLGVP
jgi:hypothetical protein